MKGMREESFQVRVDCYSGSRDAERPYRVRMGEADLPVREIMDRWHDPDAAYFKLLCNDGNIYIVKHDFDGDRWTLTQFVRTGGEREP